MKSYTIEKIYKVLVFMLLLSSIFFGISHYFVSSNGIKLILLAFLPIFIFIILINIVSKKIYVEGTNLYYSGVFGKKAIDINDLQDTSVIKMKGRILCILSDTKNYIFLTSMFENFEEIIKMIIQNAPDNSIKNLKNIDFQEVSKKSKFMKIFLISANLFLIVFGIYNLM